VIRVLALGDSYTVGEGVLPHERWVEQWALRQRAHAIPIAAPVHVIAQTGWTTDELLDAIHQSPALGNWDRVTLLIGVNNQYRGRSVDQYRKDLKALLQIAHSATGRSEYVQMLSIPDWGQTPFGQASGRALETVSAEIDAFNGAAEALCQSLNTGFLDITAATRACSKDPAMHADDGLHPSPALYRLWAEILHNYSNFGRL
jgi:lysophospholipase L1-like esterase